MLTIFRFFLRHCYMVKGRKIKTIAFKRLTPEKPKISVKQKGREHINRVVD